MGLLRAFMRAIRGEPQIKVRKSAAFGTSGYGLGEERFLRLAAHAAFLPDRHPGNGFTRRKTL